MPESERRSIDVIVPEVSDLPVTMPRDRSWSDFEKEYLKKFYPHREYKVRDIALCLGRTIRSVERQAWSLGIRRDQ